MNFNLVALGVIFHVCLSNAAQLSLGAWAEDSTPGLKFAWDCFKALNEPPGKNVFYSPYSIMNAIGMLMLGSGWELETQLKDALRVPSFLTGKQLHKQLSNENNKLALEPEATIGVANRFFINTNLVQKINPEYRTNLAEYYNSDLQETPFTENPEQSKTSINEFVSEKTHGQITELLQTTPDPSTLLMLVNAIYFKGQWTEPFQEFMTLRGPFERSQGGSVAVEYMRRNSEFDYSQSDELNAEMVALPYTDNKKYAFYVIVPNRNSNLTYLEGRLNDSNIRQMVSNLSLRNLIFWMPKFTMKSRFSLKSMLKNLGAIGIEDSQHGQSSKVFTEPINKAIVNEIIHEAKLQINENGTVASGATSESVTMVSLPHHHPVILNRPFLFFIADVSNGFVLFWGRVEDPSLSK